MFVLRRAVGRGLTPAKTASVASTRTSSYRFGSHVVLPRTLVATPCRFFGSSRFQQAQPQPGTTSTNSPPPHAEEQPIDKLRNISIIAHIDAGKTTLTERLLHHTRALSAGGNAHSFGSMPGDVDSGSTVTDFLEQERQRGITIQSAAVGPVWWSPSTGANPKTANARVEQPVGITLVDTPGHIDFGIEVERALRVVDGAVVVLDGVEGVESQTENVWSQASRYDVRSLLLFINKLDRVGSSVSHSLRSVIRSGLHSRPLLLQLPIRAAGDEAGMSGVVDLLTMEKVLFTGNAGEVVTRTLLRTEDALAKGARLARHALIESLASLDDELMDQLFSVPTASGEEPHAQIPATSIQKALRRQTLSGTVLPVLCGSAAKNIGVQPLLDAIADYLPSPTDKAIVNGRILPTPDATHVKTRKGNAPGLAATSTSREGERDFPIALTDQRTIALAFKVVHDKRRGPITFVRVYAGRLQPSSVLFNTSTGNRERLAKVMFPFADQYVEASNLRAGQIGVLIGLKDTRTGDTLVDVSYKEAKSGVALQTLRLKRVHVPPPVFSMSLEAASKSEEEAVSAALNLLIRTDPSLHLDEGNTAAGSTTGQTVLSGMGELHLEIAKDRLENEFGVNARMGSVRVSYRETLDESLGTLNRVETIERDLAGKRIKIGARIRVRCLSEEEGLGNSLFGGNIVEILGSPEQQLKAKATDADDVAAYLSTPKPDANRAVQEEEDEDSEDAVDWRAVESSFKSGLVAALSRGPLTSNPLMGLHVTIADIQLFGDLSSPSSISYVVSSLMRNVLRGPVPIDPATGAVKGLAPALTRLMEPMMTTRITVPDVHLGRVISDITSEQDGIVTDVIHATQMNSLEVNDADIKEQVFIPAEEDAGDSSRDAVTKQSQTGKAEVHAVIPLAKLVRYSSKLRALTAGNAQYSMQLEGFAKVSDSRQAEILQELGR